MLDYLTFKGNKFFKMFALSKLCYDDDIVIIRDFRTGKDCLICTVKEFQNEQLDILADLEMGKDPFSIVSLEKTEIVNGKCIFYCDIYYKQKPIKLSYYEQEKIKYICEHKEKFKHIFAVDEIRRNDEHHRNALYQCNH